jgi:D-amino-acid oxidase
MSEEKKRVVVVGAGVLGLTAAYELLRSNNYSVTIIAKNIPGDINSHYVSPFAGANWSSFATLDDTFTQELDKPSYLKFRELAESEPSSAILNVKDVCYIRKSQLVSNNGEIPLPWYKDFVTGFRVWRKDEIPAYLHAAESDEIVAAYEYDTVTITTALYLTYLLQKVEVLGGRLFRKSVKHIDDAYQFHHSGKRAHLVVNSTGLLASKLGGVNDDRVFPIRGQIVRVRNNFPTQVSVKTPGYAGELFYAFPRKEGGGIIGGTFIERNWSTVVDPDLSKRIIERAKKYIPELTSAEYGNDEEIDVIEEYVGLRPAREGGVRIERVGSIIHNYGIGGAGYQASYGLAEKVLKLANEYFRSSKL